ncbi:hypothetical protein Bca101_067709 [Brassica carinata]
MEKLLGGAGFAEENENITGRTKVSTASPVPALVSNLRNLHNKMEFNEIRCVLDVFLSPSCDSDGSNGGLSPLQGDGRQSEASSQSLVPGFVFLLEDKISVASDLHLVAVAREDSAPESLPCNQQEPARRRRLRINKINGRSIQSTDYWTEVHPTSKFLDEILCKPQVPWKRDPPGSPDENPYSLQIAKEDSARSFQVPGKSDTSTNITGPRKQHVQELYSGNKNRPGYLLISGLHMPKFLPARYQGTILRQRKKLQLQHKNLKEHQPRQDSPSQDSWALTHILLHMVHGTREPQDMQSEVLPELRPSVATGAAQTSGL